MAKCKLCSAEFEPVEVLKDLPEIVIPGQRLGNPFNELCPACGIKLAGELASKGADILATLIRVLRKEQKDIGFK